jgi:hypothetical protein
LESLVTDFKVQYFHHEDVLHSCCPYGIVFMRFASTSVYSVSNLAMVNINDQVQRVSIIMDFKRILLKAATCKLLQTRVRIFQFTNLVLNTFHWGFS